MSQFLTPLMIQVFSHDSARMVHSEKQGKLGAGNERLLIRPNTFAGTHEGQWHALRRGSTKP
jgi:hypothetical protein